MRNTQDESPGPFLDETDGFLMSLHARVTPELLEDITGGAAAAA